MLVAAGRPSPEARAFPGETEESAAQRILGVNGSRVGQFVESGRVPFEVHSDGHRIYRREQMLTVANARAARWH